MPLSLQISLVLLCLAAADSTLAVISGDLNSQAELRPLSMRVGTYVLDSSGIGSSLATEVTRLRYAYDAECAITHPAVHVEHSTFDKVDFGFGYDWFDIDLADSLWRGTADL